MSANQIVIALVAVWTALITASFAHAALYNPAGQGLAGGFTVLVIFFGWQLGALIAAFATLIVRLVRNQQITGWVRWLGFVPAVLSGALIIYIAVATAMG